MNKLKVAAQELRDHLGRDAIGLRLLEQLMEVANEQRKRCAALEVATDNSQASARRLRSDLDAAQLKYAALVSVRDRETDRRVAAESRAKALAQQLAETQEPDDDGLEDSSQGTTNRTRSMERLIKRVRRRYRKLPTPSGGSGRNGVRGRRMLYVEDFVKSFTNDEFMDLGMLIATCAFMGMGLSVDTEHPIGKDDGWKEEYSEKFVSWYRDWIYVSPLEDRVHMQAGSHLPDSVMNNFEGSR